MDSEGAKARPNVEFRQVFESEYTYVERTLRRFGIREHEVADYTQEVFIRVHQHFDKYDETKPIRPWLFTFAYHMARNYWRLARTTRVENMTRAKEPVTTQNPESVSSDNQLRDLLLEGLAQLNIEKKTALIMHDLDGFSAPEIATTLGIPLNTVYSRIRHARAELKAALTTLQQPSASVRASGRSGS